MLKFTNNAEGTLSAGITSGDTSIPLTAGHGARFPATSAEDWFIGTLIDTSNNIEIVKVTSRSTDTLTVERGYDGSTPRAFSSNDRFALRWCRADAEAAKDEAVIASAASGTDTYTANLLQIPKAYNTNQLYKVKFPAANTITNPTINFNSMGAKTIKRMDGSALSIGDIVINGFGLLFYNGTDMLLVNPATSALPAGATVDFAGTAAPTGFLLCDGSNVSRTTYAVLFTAIGVTWGPGDGSTTFGLPDFRRRAAVGSGGAGTGTLGNATGNTGGTETHQLTEGQMPRHYHQMVGPNSVSVPQNNEGAFGVYGGGTPDDGAWAYGTWSTGQAAASGSHTTGTAIGDAHNTIQPSAVVTKIIKT